MCGVGEGGGGFKGMSMILIICKDVICTFPVFSVGYIYGHV